MTDLTPVPGASAVPQLETNTLALGGTGNPMNMQAQALLNRSALNAQNISTLDAEVTALQVQAEDVGPRVDALEAHNTDVVDPSIERSGVANTQAWGNIKQNTNDYATIGPNLAPALSGFTKTNFDASGNHAAGTVGTMTAPAIGPDFSCFVFSFSINTTNTGRVNIKTNGSPIIGDQPNGYLFSTAPVLTVGIENNRPINSTDYAFMVETSGTAFSTLTIETDTAWSGQITNISIAQVTETKFAVGGSGTGNGPKNPMGIKVGSYARNDMAVGDKFSLCMFQYDGLPQTPAHNLAIGAKTLATNQHGDQNTAIGTYALEFNETSNNTAAGYSASKLNTKGREIASFGYKAATSGTIGSRNSAFGFWSQGLNSWGNENSTFGWYSLRNMLNGELNTAVGSRTGMMLIGGNNNTFMGALAGYNGGTGNQNFSGMVSVGAQSQTFGENAIAIGMSSKAGLLATPSAGSVAIGNNTTSQGTAPSVAIGNSSSATGSRTISIGEQSKATADQGTVVGALAEANGVGTVAMGVQAGAGNTGQNNVFLGRQAGGLGVNAFENCVLLGMGTTVTGSNQVQLGGTGTTPYAYVALQIRSDARDKIDARKLTKCIEFIRGLKFKEYRNNFREDYFDEVEREIEVDEQVTSYDAKGKATVTTRKVLKTLIERVPVENDGSRAGERFRAGVFAQEVKALCEELGIDWAGLQHHAVEGGKDVYTVAYELLIPYLGEATQHLLDRQDELEARLIALEQKA